MKKNTLKNNAKVKIQNAKNKVVDAKIKYKSMLDKIKALSCYGMPDFTSSKCLTCQGLSQCAEKQIDNKVKAAKPARAAKKTSKKTVGLIDLFAIILQAETSINILDFIRLAMQAGNGKNGMPVVNTSQVFTHLEHLSKGKSAPLNSQGLIVGKGINNIYLTDRVGVLANQGNFAPMFGYM